MPEKFYIHFSNRLEALAADFCDNIYMQVREDEFSPEYVILQTHGTGIFLEQEIAKKTIAANLKMPFLNSFIDQSLAAFLTEEEEKLFLRDSKLFNCDTLSWRIDRILRDEPENYPNLPGRENGETEASFRQKQHTLARQIGEMYDKCQYHRPEDLLAFVDFPSKYPSWQAKLYRELSQNGRGREYHFKKAINAEVLKRPELLPKRISLFGFNSLPKYTLHYLKTLSKFIEVHLFCLNPSCEYWSDLRSRYEMRKSGASWDEEEKEERLNNILLADFGMQERDFLKNLLDEVDLSGENETAIFTAPIKFGNSTLHQVQNDIYEVTTPQEKFDKEHSPAPDDSIQIHNCHSIQREVEVLHDQILDAIEKLKLEYRDIIITAPNINDYAPALKAVFSRGPLADALLISDRTLEGSGIVTEALLTILEMPKKRCSAGEIVDILSLPAMQLKHNISDLDLDNIRKLIADGTICWGKDGEDHQQQCEVNYFDFSWDDGIERLWLGFALGDSVEKYDEFYPVRSGISPAVLAKMAAVVNKLLEIRKKLSKELTVAEFRPVLKEIYETLLPDGDEVEEELTFLKSKIEEILSAAVKAGCDYPIQVEIYRDEIRRISTAGIDRQHFLRGKINCCSLVPMRSIPAKFVAVLGMDENSFPRRDSFASFDLTKERRRGDRSKIFEDRYLFLEALLSAREKLLFFYRGQNENNEILPPAIPLAELADYLKNYYGVTEIRQKFHNFAPIYFSGEDPKYFSYDEVYAIAAREIAAKNAPKIEHIQMLQPEAGSSCPVPEVFELEDLVKILENPCRNYLQNHSDLSSKYLSGYGDDDGVSGEEPWEINLLDQNDLLQDLLMSTQGKNQDEIALERQNIFKKACGKRILPPGEFGRELFDELTHQLDNLPTREKGIIQRSVDKEFSFSCEEGVIHAVIPCDDSGNHCTVCLCATEKNHIKLYIQQLLISLDGKFNGAQGSLFNAKEKSLKNISVIDPKDAGERLAGLLKIAKASFNKAIPFFKKSAFGYVYPGSKTDPIEKAKKVFFGNESSEAFSRAENTEPAISMLFAPDFFDHRESVEKFAQLAQQIYAPDSVTTAENAKKGKQQ